VWSTDAVRGVIAILAAIDNPADEVALLAALRNPGFACSDADLLEWRGAGGLWSIFAATGDRVPEDLTPDHPVAAALNALRRWHEQRWWIPVNELAEHVVRDLRLVELTAAQRRPRDHWRRLRFVVDQARAWCDAGGSGLGGFVAWALRQMENDADVLETVVPEPDDDAVRILTVHGSKGLEFPITMVTGLAGGLGPQPKVIWTDGGLEIRLKADVLETPGWDAAYSTDKEHARRESIRLLYVALTRAMDHLVLGCYYLMPKTKTKQATHAQRLWDLLSGSDLVVTELDGPAAGVVDDPMAPVADHRPVPDRAAFLAERAELLAAVDRRVATSPTAKVGAVIASEDEDVEEPDKPEVESDSADAPDPTVAAEPPRFRLSSRRGAAIGTATHRVLELADLACPARAEIARLTRMACADAGIAELVNDVESRVWSALSSDPVRSIAAGAVPHSEVYLVVPDEDRFVEGYIDLLLRQPEGGLEIWDYKTDRATTPAEVEAKQVHYGPQLAAYAGAVESVTGIAPESTGLIFARSGVVS
jgi:ATP-dependent helicase/nuclease subunit A